MNYFEFDVETQRFLINRWRTNVGQVVYKEIVEQLKKSGGVRNILDHYVIEDHKFYNPYEFPIYPKNRMNDGEFWVLTQDDLRGIAFYNQDFSSSIGLSITSLSYCSFYNCNLSNSVIEKADFSFTRFEKCNLANSKLLYSGGHGSSIISSNLNNSCCMFSWFIDCKLNGTDLSGVYFEGAYLKNVDVDYLTKFDKKIRETWEEKSFPPEQKPDILRAIRIAYEKAELWDQMDNYLLEEKISERKYILWPTFTKKKTIENFATWFLSFFFGTISDYSTNPFRLIIINIFIALMFSFLYLYFGTPTYKTISISAILESIYFSFSTFATLGFGDVVYSVNHPILRILSSLEAWAGAIFTSLFVVVLARKIFR